MGIFTLTNNKPRTTTTEQTYLHWSAVNAVVRVTTSEARRNLIGRFVNTVIDESYQLLKAEPDGLYYFSADFGVDQAEAMKTYQLRENAAIYDSSYFGF